MMCIKDPFFSKEMRVDEELLNKFQRCKKLIVDMDIYINFHIDEDCLEFSEVKERICQLYNILNIAKKNKVKDTASTFLHYFIRCSTGGLWILKVLMQDISLCKFMLSSSNLEGKKPCDLVTDAFLDISDQLQAAEIDQSSNPIPQMELKINSLMFQRERLLEIDAIFKEIILTKTSPDSSRSRRKSALPEDIPHKSSSSSASSLRGLFIQDGEVLRDEVIAATKAAGFDERGQASILQQLSATETTFTKIRNLSVSFFRPRRPSLSESDEREFPRPR